MQEYGFGIFGYQVKKNALPINRSAALCKGHQGHSAAKEVFV